jgi:chromatin remodeling complex protein RSC6
MAATIDTVSADIQALQKDVKSLRKMIRKVLGDIEDPTGEKKAARAQNNGFNKPQVVTEALQKFLGLEVGATISRAQVTKAVNSYVTEKGLKQGQLITLDDPLKALLNPPADAQITFLNIQKYLNQHYIKQEKPAVEKKPAAEKKPAVEGEEKKAARPKVAKK